MTCDVKSGPCSCGAWHKPNITEEAMRNCILPLNHELLPPSGKSNMIEFNNILLPEKELTFDNLETGDLFVVKTNPSTMFIKTAHNKCIGYEITKYGGVPFSAFVLEDKETMLNLTTHLRKVKFVGKLSYI